jgi:hypothetical protein
MVLITSVELDVAAADVYVSALGPILGVYTYDM